MPKLFLKQACLWQVLVEGANDAEDQASAEKVRAVFAHTLAGDDHNQARFSCRYCSFTPSCVQTKREYDRAQSRPRCLSLLPRLATLVLWQTAESAAQVAGIITPAQLAAQIPAPQPTAGRGGHGVQEHNAEKQWESNKRGAKTTASSKAGVRKVCCQCTDTRCSEVPSGNANELMTTCCSAAGRHSQACWQGHQAEGQGCRCSGQLASKGQGARTCQVVILVKASCRVDTVALDTAYACSRAPWNM